MTFKNNKTKITATIMASLTIGLLMMSPLTIVPNVTAQSTAAEQLKTQIEPQPTAIGCYHYTKATGWQTMPCISAEEWKKNPGDIPIEGGLHGLKGGITTSTNPNFGEVDVHFSQYGGETDSKTGTTAWSIQTNTNNYTGHDGDKHWIQFVTQNKPGYYLQNCIWEFDLTTGTYINPPPCVPITTAQTLSSTYEGFVTGYVVSSSSLRSTYCNVGTGNCWSVVGTNAYDLGTYWTQTTGTILGQGAGSTATFVSPTQETTTVQASPESSANTFWSDDTGEMNNLNYNSVSTSCGGGNCNTVSVSSN